MYLIRSEKIIFFDSNISVTFLRTYEDISLFFFNFLLLELLLFK